MKNFTFKQFMPHLIVLGIFLLITVAYFSPMLEGKVLKQMDETHAIGMAKEVQDFEKNNNGEYTAWTNSMFGGMPSYQIKGGPNKSVFVALQRILRFGLPFNSMAILFLLLSGFYVLLITLKLDPWLGLIGAIAFAFSSYNFVIIDAGHIAKAYAIAYMAPVIAGILITYRGKILTGGIFTAIALGLEISCNHPQITYYLFLMILALVIIMFIHSIIDKKLNQFIKASSILVIAAILAILPSTTMLWTTYEYGKETIRGKAELINKNEKVSSGLDKDYALDWSYGIAETFTILVPNFQSGDLNEHSKLYEAIVQKGIPENNAKQLVEGISHYTYWGKMPFTAGTVYFGAIICFLFVLGLFIVKGSIKWWLLAITILSIVLAWGKNFPPVTDFFFYYFPLYNKFRAVSTTLVIAGFSMPLLGLLALKNIFLKEIDKKILLKYLKISFAIVGGLCLVFSLIPGWFFDFTSPKDESIRSLGLPEEFANLIITILPSDRESLLRMDAFRSFIFIFFAAGLIWLYIKDKLKYPVIIAGLALLITVDLWSVDKRYLNEKEFFTPSEETNDFQKTAADEEILKDKDTDFRVFNVTTNPFTEVHTSYFHKSIGGYHGAKLRRYQDLIEHQISKNNRQVLNMLNTKYIIGADHQGNSIAQLNPFACGHAWFVNEYKLVNSPNEEMDALTNFEPLKTAIIDKRFENQLKNYTNAKDSSSIIKLLEYKPNHLTYQTETNKPQLAIFSEIFYDHGWDVFVDSKPAPYFRADYVLRSMIVPAGKHTIEFKFEPKSYYLGQKISLASSILIVILLIGAIFIKVKKSKEVEINKE